MGSRRSNHEGSVVRRSDGKWVATIQMGGKRVYLYAATRAEVVEKLDRIKGTAWATGALPASAKLEVGNYLTEWLRQAEGRLRPTTVSDYGIIITRHVIPAIGSTKLGRLYPTQLAHMYATIGERVSPRRVRMIHDFLHKTLRDAVRRGLLASNPADAVDAPRRDAKEPILWTPDETTSFLKAMLDGKGGHYGNLLIFLLGSGCRIGEALGLRWTDVDWDHRSVKIERQLVEIGGDIIEGPPKSRSGFRTVALPDWTMTALQRQKAMVAELRLKASGSWRGGDCVFVTSEGTTPSRSNVKRALHTASDVVGAARLSPHGLRHMHISLLAHNGVSLKTAQQRAGHSSATTTMKVYTHVLGQADRLAAAALEDIV